MKGLLDFELVVNNKNFFNKNCLLSDSFGEPTSVLDSRIPGGLSSSSTLSSSLGGSGGGGGGAGSTDTAGVAAVSERNTSPKWQQDSTTATSSTPGGGASELLPVPPSLEISGGGTTVEDWENVLSECGGQEHSMFKWIMGDVEDPSMKVLQISGGAASGFEFGGGFGVIDQAFVGDSPVSSFYNNNGSNSENIDLKFSQNLMYPPSISHHLHPAAFDSSAEAKPPIFNPQLLINQHYQNQWPFSYEQHQEHSVFVPPQTKRLNSGVSIGPQRPTGLGQFKMDGGDLSHQQQIIDHLFKAAELLQMGNPVLAQGILARLNHHLSPIGKPFYRAAFYCKEALQLLLHTNNASAVLTSSPVGLVFKIGAYKSFSEISPLIEFANFTCNQALLEVLDGYDRIHIVDFDIGYGGQWASLMQELAIMSGGAPVLKITALASSSTHDQLELSLTRENLIHFANEINIAFEFEVICIDSLNSVHFQSSDNEAIAVNLPIGCLTNHQLSVPSVLRFVKHLSPKIIVSIDRGCDRTDLPFANHIIHTLQSYSNLLESLDAVNVNMDAVQKIERFLLQPGIEKIVMGRFRSLEKSQNWRTLLLSSGFTPVTFSNFTESQAECVVKKTPVRGFQVEKRQSSLVLCWQRKELVSVSVWRC